MVVKLADNTGKIQAVHLTLLNPDTNNKANVEQAKLKFGPVPDKINIDLNTKPTNSGITLIAEGLETALSLKTALLEYDVKAALDKSGFTRIDLDKTAKNVVLCLDNDLNNWREDKIINNAISRLEGAGKTVWIAMPETVNKQKTDFNDVLQINGIDKIRQTINYAEKHNQPELRLFHELKDIKYQAQTGQRTLQQEIINQTKQQAPAIDSTKSKSQVKDRGLER